MTTFGKIDFLESRWDVESSRDFTSSEIALFPDPTVVYDGMEYGLKGDDASTIYLHHTCNLKPGDKVDLHSSKLLTLRRRHDNAVLYRLSV